MIYQVPNVIKKNQQVDVLNLEFSPVSGRDSEPSVLVTNFLKRLGFGVLRGSVFEGKALIIKYEPRCVFMSGPHGSGVKFDLALLCKRMGIPLVCYPGEGAINLTTFNSDAIWGHNWIRAPIHSRWALWNRRSLDAIKTLAPPLAKISEVTGYAGADLAKLRYGKNRESAPFQNFKMTVGVGCWCFAKFNAVSPQYKKTKEKFGDTNFNDHKFDRDFFNSVLRELIISQPDWLFLVRRHPGKKNSDWDSGTENISRFSNVRFADNWNLFELLDSVDVWVSYKSITALQACLQGTPAVFLVGSNKKPHLLDPSLGGIPSVSCKNELLDFFDSVTLSNGGDSAGNQLILSQENYLKGLFGELDGLNHVRVASVIVKILENSSTEIKKVRKRDHIEAFLEKTIALRDRRNLRWKFSGDKNIVHSLNALQGSFYCGRAGEIESILKEN